MQQPLSFTLVLVPMLLLPAAIAAWYMASIFKRVEWFAWASILQVSVSAACVMFYLFGTLQNDRTMGMAVGLFVGLTIAYAGKILLDKSR
ncbi:hypothetical protein SJI00_21210 [Pseudomonas sp. RP23018S]|uniref:hypothetical protein n=1 Tax=Pseudomonas sp. RP23018S TaxID=3096037 RepID=UPI002ACA9FE0|nr:hypothetical protein [Pseudomonas sp. RP23018S]MDZ5605297.1 hypothetical protein [Pseudomonas sp. RP23018S]